MYSTYSTGELPPGHSGILNNVDGTGVRFQIISKQGQGSYDYGNGQGHYSQSEESLYGHGQSAYGHGGQASRQYSGQQSSYGYNVHVYINPGDSGSQASGSSLYTGGSGARGTGDSATGRKSYYQSGGSYGQSASSGYAYGYGDGQDTYSYGGARASAYDPDDEEPVSVMAHYHVHNIVIDNWCLIPRKASTHGHLRPASQQSDPHLTSPKHQLIILHLLQLFRALLSQKVHMLWLIIIYR